MKNGARHRAEGGRRREDSKESRASTESSGYDCAEGAKGERETRRRGERIQDER